MYEFSVEKMNCGGCAKTLTKAVLGVDKDAKVNVDLASKKVTVESTASLQELESTISRAGYPVRAACSI